MLSAARPNFNLGLTEPRTGSRLHVSVPVMSRRVRRRSRDTLPLLPRGRAVTDGLPRHLPSPTAVAAEAMRTGVVPMATPPRRLASAHEDALLFGDPDDDAMTNEYVGEEMPGGSNPTPDQSAVDEIGRAYGLQDEDSGELRSAEDLLGRRDRHRHELQPPHRRP
jgi:hypothetical protein